MDLTPRDIMQKLEEVGEEMRRTWGELGEVSAEAARNDSRYRLNLVQSCLKASHETKTVKMAEWFGQAAAENDRLEAKIAEAKRDALREKIRALNTEMQSWIAITYMVRSEIQMTRAGYE